MGLSHAKVSVPEASIVKYLFVVKAKASVMFRPSSDAFNQQAIPNTGWLF
jgi:hypothetical protein